MGDIAAHNDLAGQEKARGDRMLAELGANVIHGAIQIDLNGAFIIRRPRPAETGPDRFQAAPEKCLHE